MANNLQKLMQKYMKTLDIDLLKFQANLEEKYGAIAEEIKKSKMFIITYMIF